MHSNIAIENPTVPKPRNTELEIAVVERCRKVADLTSGAVGLTSKSIYRWCVGDGIDMHYTTIHRACQRLISDGMLESLDSSTELVPTQAGRRMLMEQLIP